MISRRNIRVKVMQTLYALESGSPDGISLSPEKLLTSKFLQTRNLFTYIIYFISEVARYAEKDAHIKGNKHLPTAEDLSVNTKISGNELPWLTFENNSFHQVVKDAHLEHITDVELVKKMYQQLVQSEEYKDYISISARTKKNEKKILEYILNHILLPNEEFCSHIEEHFINWDDDAEQMQILATNYFNKPNGCNFNEILGEEKKDFAFSLLKTVKDKEEINLSMIKEKLKNWDADRIAALDMIMLHMGLCEMLYFETIPTRVTINEYIDLAKAYSTPQSGQFVNGLLDTLNKELSSQNKIHKKVYKNSTL